VNLGQRSEIFREKFEAPIHPPLVVVSGPSRRGKTISNHLALKFSLY
jgi:hypothetical protein